MSKVTLHLYTVDPKSWASIVIAIVTGSIYTHSGIQVGDKLFEASGKRGTLDWTSVYDYQDRHVRKIELPVTMKRAREILAPYKGLEYDYKALRLWCFSSQNKKKYYCFEHCWQFLKEIGVTDYTPKRVTANSILTLLRGTNG